MFTHTAMRVLHCQVQQSHMSSDWHLQSRQDPCFPAQCLLRMEPYLPGHSVAHAMLPSSKPRLCTDAGQRLLIALHQCIVHRM